MKKLIALFTALLFLNILSAQIRTIANVTFEDASMMAYELDINANSDKVIDLWDQYWDKQHDVDVDREDRNRKRQVYLAKEVEVTAISDKQLDVYSKITTTEENKTTISLGIGFGYDVYASKENYSQEFAAAKTVLEEFEQYFYDNYYAEKLANLRDKLQDAKGEVEDMQDDIDKNQRQIERWTKDIEDTKNSIAKAEEETKETREAIESQKKTVNQLETEMRGIEQMASQWNIENK